ncbi:MAG: C/D box methylation guide ribonucleoprotein complex aNOP56 subunit, partial [Desulfurococcales archaeon]|nr:C/D box methylation guide ribonucleoprotein complex aNOP56 subunit [Desulfurococcales archaeon]
KRPFWLCSEGGAFFSAPLAIKAIRGIYDIDKTINLFAARLREWYSIHFPELDDLVADHLNYAKVVSQIGDRSGMTVESLRRLGFGTGKSERIVKASKKSIGAELSDFDVEQMKKLANIMLELGNLRTQLTEYISKVMREVAPNITELVGPLLGARLLSLAGSLENLAKMPASTIQVLGAEKALFRALRTGGRPPKHGVIFQYPEIHSAPRWQRGKIARALATKLAIAAKADYFTGRYIADKLKKELVERIEEIKELYAKPPKKVERPKEERRRRPRGRRKLGRKRRGKK